MKKIFIIGLLTINTVLLIPAVEIEKTEINEIESNQISLNNQLIIAAKAGDIDSVKELLEKGAEVSAKDKDGWVPLHIAACSGSAEVAGLLIEAKAEVNAKITEGILKGWTPLHFAAKNNFAEVVEQLITAGATVDATSIKDFTPLHFAAEKGSVEVAGQLIKAGAKMNAKIKDGTFKGYTPLHFAAENNSAEVAGQLIKAGAKMNAKIKDGTFKGYTPLHFAAENNSAEVVEQLITADATVDATSNNGLTSLHHAATCGHEKVVKELTATPIVLKQPNNANSKLSKETLKKDDNSKDEFVRLFKELPVPALKSVAKGLFPVKDNDEPIIKALLKFSYQHLKENHEQQQSSFAKLFIRKFYNNHLLELKLYITIEDNFQLTASDRARIDNKENIADYLENILKIQSYDDLDEDLRTQTERNYKQLVKYIEAKPMEIE